MDRQMCERARTLRGRQTDAERWLWSQLRAERYMGLKFKRQVPIGAYIVDFVCHAQRLIIELDGGQHAEQTDYDGRRSDWLNGRGYAVLRFWNHDVLRQGAVVLESIRLWLEQERPAPLAPLLEQELPSPPAPLP